MVFQLFAVPELAGLGGAGLSGGSPLGGGGLPARSLCHDARQQLLQLFRRLLREHPPGRAMCQRRELFARRLVHGTLHEKRGVIDAARRNGVHHPGHL